jgi:hypothetical protein
MEAFAPITPPAELQDQKPADIVESPDERRGKETVAAGPDSLQLAQVEAVARFRRMFNR